MPDTPIDVKVPYTCAMGLVWDVLVSAMAASARPSSGFLAPNKAKETADVELRCFECGDEQSVASERDRSTNAV